MSIRSGDIRDQTRKLSKIKLSFGHFLPSQILLGAHLAKLGGSKLTVLLYGYWIKVHRTCLAERGRNCSRSRIFPLLISCLVPEIFAIKVGSCVKSVQILHVFGPPNLLGEAPEFLDPDYLIRVDSDHVVKFCGDRPRELGDPMADLKKTSRLKHNVFRNYCSGRPNNCSEPPGVH